MPRSPLPLLHPLSLQSSLHPLTTLPPFLCCTHQGFNWESWHADGGWYAVLRRDVRDLAAAGFTDVWLPPASKSVAPQG